MKKYIICLIAALMVLMLAACGSSSDTPAQDGSEDKAGEQEQEEEVAEEVHPYAWLGLQDMPTCDYVDILVSNHYYKKSAMYVKDMSYVGKEINAVDGINTFKDDGNSKTYSIGGKITSINENSKTYMEEDMSDMAEAAAENYEKAMEEGTNMPGRSFVEKGSGTIPVYSEQAGDKGEYEYYEYHYPELEKNGEDSYTERFYMKDGDVFVIYNKTVWGDTVIESAEAIKKMTADIPDGTFDVPDLTGYKKQN